MVDDVIGVDSDRADFDCDRCERGACVCVCVCERERRAVSVLVRLCCCAPTFLVRRPVRYSSSRLSSAYCVENVVGAVSSAVLVRLVCAFGG